MSRAAQQDVMDTASSESATNEAAAQKSEQATEADIGQQQSALAKFASQNPYVQGGQAQVVTNQQVAGTADATAAAAQAKNQQQAQRTGQNAAAGVAAGEAEQQAAQRTMGTEEAGATQSRLAAGAAYGQAVQQAGAGITDQQAKLAGIQQGASQGELGVEEQAAQTPSWTDMGGTLLLGGSSGICWVAAATFGGWYEPRTVLVREWMFGPFRASWYGRFLTDLYKKYGERAAALMGKNRLIRWVLMRLMESALYQARKDQERGKGGNP